jgi:hypothetical protein
MSFLILNKRKEVTIIMMKWLKKKPKEQSHTIDLSNNTYVNIVELIDNANYSADFIHYPQKTVYHKIFISYYKAMIDGELLHRDVLPYLIHSKDFKVLKDLKDILPIESVTITNDIKEIQNKLLRGFIVVQVGEYDEECAVRLLSQA